MITQMVRTCGWMFYDHHVTFFCSLCILIILTVPPKLHLPCICAQMPHKMHFRQPNCWLWYILAVNYTKVPQSASWWSETTSQIRHQANSASIVLGSNRDSAQRSVPETWTLARPKGINVSLPLHIISALHHGLTRFPHFFPGADDSIN